MSDMLGSIVSTIMSGNTVMPSKTTAADEQRFSDMLKEADKKTPATITASVTKPTTAAEKFMKYQEMTAAEKFRASYLAEKGLTEDDLKAMSAEDRAKIEEEIAAKIREKVAEGVEKKLASMG